MQNRTNNYIHTITAQCISMLRYASYRYNISIRFITYHTKNSLSHTRTLAQLEQSKTWPMAQIWLQYIAINRYILYNYTVLYVNSNRIGKTARIISDLKPCRRAGAPGSLAEREPGSPCLSHLDSDFAQPHHRHTTLVQTGRSLHPGAYCDLTE